MSVLLTGLLGVAVTVAPSLFRILAADRDGGDIREEAEEIVERLLDTKDEQAAQKKVANDNVLAATLKKALEDLKDRALEEQARAAKEQERIEEAFLELESAEREQQRKQLLEQLNTEFKSVEAARDHALEMSKSDKWWVAGINPLLSIVITLGFISTLAFIFYSSGPIQNIEIFYTAIGALATAFATVIGFHFGSSTGSRDKDEMILSAPQQPADGTNLQYADGAPGLGSGQLSSEGSVSGQTHPSPRPKPPTSLPDPGGTFGLFRQKAPGIIQDLMNEFGLTLNQSAGILGNIGHECAGFRKLQEVKPIVPGSRGGWGWVMWTGPRRRAFEAWCKDNKFKDLSDDEANYGFLIHELQTTEKRALAHLRKTQSLRDATKSFMNKFERPGIQHFDSRLNWAQEALKASRSNSF
ncbi:hypothetical protein LP7551_02043 [Roseibium album]|nr:hypothetical protein LP7551_02043 [Roseibium album]